LTEGVQIIECPRDAWQGLTEIIPTETKVEYLLHLAAAGFKHIDAVSFVSPKHVRQMADSEDVMKEFLAGLPAGAERPEIIGIVVNEQGMERALATPGVTTLGYPYSIASDCRKPEAGDKIFRPRAGRVYFDGIWKSVRRALGAGNR
jgi:hydroxymethylglutaryl-CoA lyase